MFQTTPSGSSQAIRLFCIPHAGAGPSAFRGWTPDLAPEIQVVLAEFPGREGRFRQQPYRSMTSLVEGFTRAVLPYIEEKQEFAFFGNSMGGLIAFEVLDRIRRLTGREALHLFVSATGAPHLPCPLPPVAGLSDLDLLYEIRTRYDGIPPEVLADEEFLTAVLGTIRADMQVLESYTRQQARALNCPITAFAGRRDRTVTLVEIQAWREQTSDSFQLIELDEDHLFLQTARAQLTETIRATLLKVGCAP